MYEYYYSIQNCLNCAPSHTNWSLTPKNYQIFPLRPDSAAQREFRAPLNLNAKQVIATRLSIRYVSRNIAFIDVSFWLWFTTSSILSTSLAWRGILMMAFGGLSPQTALLRHILKRMRTALLWHVTLDISERIGCRPKYLCPKSKKDWYIPQQFDRISSLGPLVRDWKIRMQKHGIDQSFL